MSTVKTNNVQIGQSVTATNNFTWYQPSSPDGTVRLGNGNSGSVTDLVTLTSAGNLGIGTSSPSYKLDINGTARTSGIFDFGAGNVNTSGSGSYKAVNFGAASGAYNVLYTGSTSLNINNSTDTAGLLTLTNSGNLGIGTSSPGARLEVSGSAYITGGVGGQGCYLTRNGSDGGAVYSAQTGSIQISAPSTNPITFVTNSTEKMRLDSSGNLGIGTSSPGAPLDVYNSTSKDVIALRYSVLGKVAGIYLDSASVYYGAGANNYTNAFVAGHTANYAAVRTADTERLRIDASGNLGLGVTPSGWYSTFKAFEMGAGSIASTGASQYQLLQNSYVDAFSGSYTYKATAQATRYQLSNGVHSWFTAPSGTAGNAISFTQAMTLDASGRLLIVVTSTADTANVFQAADGISAYAASSFSFTAANAAACCLKVGSQTTGRSINAKGTINASGADYAEYMVKAGDFEIAKGDICGINSNGLLTNVFADAVSFAVKSTDPSYVGNDSWGAGIEDQDALEAERQKVDRIAFAGQVPVNVFGAKAGDYIIPVADKKGIKGAAVSNPTFEQYQIAVGKVIAVEADGRAKIIVKAT